MAAPRVTVQGAEVLYHRGPHGVKVDIANQFEQVRLFLAQDRLVTILEEIPVTVMAAVERRRVSGQEAPHDHCQRNGTGAE
jgi:hypothetical protein